VKLVKSSWSLLWEEKNRWDHLKQNLQQQQGNLKGDIRIFASITASYSILPNLLRQFRKDYPEVRVHLRTGDPADGPSLVREEQVDMAIAAIPLLQAQGLHSRVLTNTALVFVIPSVIPAYSELDERFKNGELEALYPSSQFWKKAPLILPERGLPRQRVDAWLKSQKINPQIQAQVSGNEGILAMVHLGLGIGLVPELVIKESPLIQGLTILEAPQNLEGIDIGLVVKDTRRKTPILDAFTNFMFAH
jgi:LysR family positive regulator for ilvC